MSNKINFLVFVDTSYVELKAGGIEIHEDVLIDLKPPNSLHRFIHAVFCWNKTDSGNHEGSFCCLK